MELLVNEDEISILLLLRERTAGFDEQHALKAEAIVTGLGWEPDEAYARAVGYLAGLGLVGIPKGAEPRMAPIWLTLKGETILRMVERKLKAENYLSPRFEFTLSYVLALGPENQAFILRAALDFLAGVKVPSGLSAEPHPAPKRFAPAPINPLDVSNQAPKPFAGVPALFPPSGNGAW